MENRHLTFMNLRKKLETEEEASNIPLIKAVNENNLQKIHQLIKAVADINIPAPGGGKTPLHIAVDLGHEKIVSTLVQAKADVNVMTQRKFTPLHVAAQRGNEKLIALLIKAGSNINACTDVGCTPLHEAAANGHKEAVSALLEHGANPFLRDTHYSLTPSALAHEKGHKDIYNLLASAMPYPQKFIANIEYTLFDWRRSFPIYTHEGQYIDKLSDSLKGVTDADEIFKKLSTFLKDTASADYLRVKEKLIPMRKLIIADMNQYNEDKKLYLQRKQIDNTRVQPISEEDVYSNLRHK